MFKGNFSNQSRGKPSPSPISINAKRGFMTFYKVRNIAEYRFNPILGRVFSRFLLQSASLVWTVSYNVHMVVKIRLGFFMVWSDAFLSPTSFRLLLRYTEPIS